MMRKSKEELSKKSKDFSERLKTVNAGLEKVYLCQRGQRFYLQATFPPKSGMGKWKQQEIATGAKADTEGFRKAKAKAHDLDSQLFKETFNWDDWLKDRQPIKHNLQTIGDWLDRFCEHYWQSREKTPSQEKNFKHDYLYYFHHLPSDQPISLELLRETAIANSKPETRKRQKFCKAFGALTRFAGVQSSMNDLARGYMLQPAIRSPQTSNNDRFEPELTATRLTPRARIICN
ncbi:MAG: hypothetical protein AAGA60_30005 [Cyanobacteria bacterium P01_E01_bin.42]